MGTSLLCAAWVSVLALAVGCGGGAQNPDAAAGEGGSGSNDRGATEAPPNPEATGAEGGATEVPPNPDATAAGGPVPIDAGAIEIPWAPPFSGRRAFVVTSDVLTPVSAAYHQFTLVVDADRRLAIFGADTQGGTSALASTGAGAVRLVDPVTFWSGPGVGACSSGGFRYDDLSFTVDASGALTGSGRGELSRALGDDMLRDPATMILRGVADTAAPILGLYSLPAIPDPIQWFRLVSTEPLPSDAEAILRSAGGDVITLKPSPADAYTIEFAPSILLPYGGMYTAEIDAITDFAGNRAIFEGVLSFSTGEAPPVAGADGFESVTDTALAGAQILSGAGAPIITGARSLYVPPVTQPSFVGRTQLALRLAIAPSDTVLRFSYRTVTVNPTTPFSAEYLVASVGGTIVTVELPPDDGAATPAAINGDPVMLGPLMTAAIDRPDDAAGEVSFMRRTAGEDCGLPDPPGPGGIIIDDLRTE
jgi:hypothetical protein